MYDFRTLSPLDLEDLVRDLLQAEFGVFLESFGPGKDQGIDLRYAPGKGALIVQVKHYPDADLRQLVRVARAEAGKVMKLAPGRYVFVTSATLTPHAKEAIRDEFGGVPLALADIMGRDDLNNLLGRHPEIEKQHFKLWLASAAVLERMLHSRVYNRTQAELEDIRAMVPKFVQNAGVPAAEAILDKHGTLIIAGEPGIGKSTLARMLVWLHAEQGWRISVIDDISEAFEIADGNERRLIYFDDFLGQIGLTRDLIRGLDARFPPFFAKVKRSDNLRFVLTTRDYIFRQAQAQSAKLSAADLNATEFVMNVGHYSRQARAKILFNHLYFSKLSESEREEVLADDLFLKIIDHRNFNPRLIDLLTSADYVSLSGRPIREAVWEVLENPHELWDKPYRNQISPEGRALMVALFFNSTRVALPTLEVSFGRIVNGLGFDVPTAELPGKFRSALRELEGSVFHIQERHVTFSNPGVRDFLQKAVAQDLQLASVVSAAVDFAEVSRAWEFGRATNQNHAVGAAAWKQAVARMVDRGKGTALEHLHLASEIYAGLGQFDEETFATAQAMLTFSGISDDELGLAGELLESLSLSALPEQALASTKAVVTREASRALEGSNLSLDDIESYAQTLLHFGNDEDVVLGAARSAVQTHVDDLHSTLSDMSSFSEVEEYERQLNRLADEYGAAVRLTYTTFNDRKEELSLRDEDDDRGYSGRPPFRSAQLQESDNDIRSMFNSLKSH